MNTIQRKKVASGLGKPFQVVEAEVEQQARKPHGSVEGQGRGAPRQSKRSADPLIPAELPGSIARGASPYQRSGKGRVGVSRKYSENVVKTTVVLPESVHDKLTEIVFRNRKKTKESMNDLVMLGLDLLFADYGIEPIDKLVKKNSQA